MCIYFFSFCCCNLFINFIKNVNIEKIKFRLIKKKRNEVKRREKSKREEKHKMCCSKQKNIYRARLIANK